MKTKNAKTKTSPKSAANFRIDVVPLSKIEHAPWNPRTKEEMDARHPAMVELVGSIKARGLINPVTAWQSPSGSLLCIAGNRRLAAARLAGFKSIEAKIYADVTEDEARAITRDENEVRFGVSPLADAAQIRQLMDRGLGQNEIAALFGVSEAKVCRRAKLLDLVPEVSELLAGNDIEAPALSLELIAAHPADLQRQAAHEFKTSWHFDWKPKSVRAVFDRLTRKLDAKSWVFQGDGVARLERCRHCGKCTGAQPTLFDVHDGKEPDAESNLGRCLDMACYAKMEEAAKNEIVGAALAKFKTMPTGKIVFAKNSWIDPFASAAKRPSKTNDRAIVYWDTCQHVATVRWMPDPAIVRKEKKIKAEAEKAKMAAAREEGESIRMLLNSALDKVCAFFTDSDGNISRDAIVAKLKKLPAKVLADKLACFFDDCCSFTNSPGCYSDPNWAVQNFPDLAAALTDAEKATLSNAAKDE